MKNNKNEYPKLYMSTSENKWRVIYEGLPCCKDFTDKQDAYRCYCLTRTQLHWDMTHDIPLWNGDKGIFETIHDTNGKI